MQQPTQFKLIVPADVKAWLEEQAAKNIRSKGAEIVACLRDRMTRTDLQGAMEAAVMARRVQNGASDAGEVALILPIGLMMLRSADALMPQNVPHSVKLEIST